MNLARIRFNTEPAVSLDILVGLTYIWGVPRLVGCYCSYLLPKQDGGTFQIYVNPTKVSRETADSVHTHTHTCTASVQLWLLRIPVVRVWGLVVAMVARGGGMGRGVQLLQCE